MHLTPGTHSRGTKPHIKRNPPKVKVPAQSPGVMNRVRPGWAQRRSPPQPALGHPRTARRRQRDGPLFRRRFRRRPQSARGEQPRHRIVIHAQDVTQNFLGMLAQQGRPLYI